MVCFPYLNFDGIGYSINDEGRRLAPDDLGPVLGRASSQRGMCAYCGVERGSEVYAVRGYRSAFRVAVYLPAPRGLQLFEVDENPRAKEVSDYYDISGKLAAVRLSKGVDTASGLRRHVVIDDPALVSSVEDLIMGSAMVGPKSRTWSDQYWLMELVLADGTETHTTFYSDGRFGFRLQADEELVQIFTNAFASGTQVGTTNDPQ
jgi:hypothetical protein